MTRSELITALAARFPQLSCQDAAFASSEIIEAIARALCDGQRVEIRGFGSFSLKQRAPRIGRNPKTGEKVVVPAKYVPHFKTGKELRDRVDAVSAAPSALKKDKHLDGSFSHRFDQFRALVPDVSNGA